MTHRKQGHERGPQDGHADGHKDALARWLERIHAQRNKNARHSWRLCSPGLGDGYERMRHLPALIAIMPDEARDRSAAAGLVIRQKLARALRAERMRGRAGKWDYDPNRHLALKQALCAEILDARACSLSSGEST